VQGRNFMYTDMKLRVKEEAGRICTDQRTSINILRTLICAFDYLASSLDSCRGVSPLGTSATVWPVVPAPDD
jgi:hypothetical protein